MGRRCRKPLPIGVSNKYSYVHIVDKPRTLMDFVEADLVMKDDGRDEVNHQALA
jgi:hypothetical protein